MLITARGVDLQVTGGDCGRVTCGISNLHHDVAAGISNNNVQLVITTARFQVVYGPPDERNRGFRVAAIDSQDACTMEVDDVYVHLR